MSSNFQLLLNYKSHLTGCHQNRSDHSSKDSQKKYIYSTYNKKLDVHYYISQCLTLIIVSVIHFWKELLYHSINVIPDVFY